MADKEQNPTMSAGGGKQTEVQRSSKRQGDVKTGHGGKQENAISGETAKGAHNNESRGANPDHNEPNQNRSARQKGNTF